MWRPLADVFVLDFTRLLPGPFATAILAELGARVVKVEDVAGSDFARHMPPELEGTGYAFTAVNRGKESVAVNLKTPEGVEIAKRLARRADVVVESFRPGVMARLGLGHDALAAENPKLVHASLRGYGQTGPLRDAPGHDINYVALAGALAMTGPRERPVIPAYQIADMTGGLYAAIGILAALRERDRTGRGRYLDVALHDAALASNALAVARAAAGEDLARGEVELAGAMPGYNVYRCADGAWIALGALEPKLWDKFAHAVNRPDLQDYHAMNAPKAFEAVAALFAQKPATQWERELTGADVPATRVLTPAEAIAHPHARARAPAGAPPRQGRPSQGPASARPRPARASTPRACSGRSGIPPRTWRPSSPGVL